MYDILFPREKWPKTWKKSAGCQRDSDCPLDKTCFNRNCENPCVVKNSCHFTAECYPANHVANCRCPQGYEGDPRVRCIPEGCDSDSECPLDKTCRNRNCVDPCLYEYCAPGAICTAINHRAQCSCPPGYEGQLNKFYPFNEWFFIRLLN